MKLIYLKNNQNKYKLNFKKVFIVKIMKFK